MNGRVAKVKAMLNALSDEEKRELLDQISAPKASETVPPEEPDIGVREPLPATPPPLPPAAAEAEVPESAL